MQHVYSLELKLGPRKARALWAKVAERLRREGIVWTPPADWQDPPELPEGIKPRRFWRLVESTYARLTRRGRVRSRRMRAAKARRAAQAQEVQAPSRGPKTPE